MCFTQWCRDLSCPCLIWICLRGDTHQKITLKPAAVPSSYQKKVLLFGSRVWCHSDFWKHHFGMVQFIPASQDGTSRLGLDWLDVQSKTLPAMLIRNSSRYTQTSGRSQGHPYGDPQLYVVLEWLFFFLNSPIENQRKQLFCKFLLEVKWALHFYSYTVILCFKNASHTNTLTLCS